MPSVDSTKVRWMMTYHISLSLLMFYTFMKALSRWIEEMATMEAATSKRCMSEVAATRS